VKSTGFGPISIVLGHFSGETMKSTGFGPISIVLGHFPGETVENQTNILR
jgi:hypothetical protein